jgi:hypothetical protein
MTYNDVKRMIPLVRSIIISLQECWDGIHPLRTNIEILERKIERTRQESCKIELLRLEFNEAVKRMNGYIKEVEQLGGEVRECRNCTATFRVDEGIATWSIKEGLKVKGKVFA